MATAMIVSIAYARPPSGFPNDGDIARELQQGGTRFVLPFDGAKRPANVIDRLLERTQPTGASSGGDRLAPAEVLVFVSLSMPSESLARLMRDAARIGAVLVLRGFKEDSLAKTREALQPLLTPTSSLQINPPAFSAYGVTQVPAVIVTRTPDAANGTMPTQRIPEFAGVAGDVTLAYALSHLAKPRTPLAAIATKHLAHLEGR